MKHFHTRLQRSRLGRTYRRLRDLGGKPQQTSIYQEMEQGAIIGFFASAILALHFAGGSLSAAILIFSTSLGLFVGAVIGAVLWIGSAPLPEDAVRAPAPGQKRSETDRRR
ncbi:MAG TPA: hypothetical protein VJ576_20775 [Rhodocyclaceae bacterium]|nr:hypothetical protein [Rhodocyclaceae bacterium]